MTYLPRDARREQIMNAVVDIAIREGLAAATVRRIARELGCSPGQIHHHFTSAADLRAEAIHRVWERLDQELIAAVRRLPPRERLVTILCGCNIASTEELRAKQQMAERLWKETWDQRGEPSVRAAIAVVVGKLRDELVLALNEGAESGEFRSDIETSRLAMMLIAASQGFDLLEEIGTFGEFGNDKQAFMDALLHREGL